MKNPLRELSKYFEEIKKKGYNSNELRTIHENPGVKPRGGGGGGKKKLRGRSRKRFMPIRGRKSGVAVTESNSFVKSDKKNLGGAFRDGKKKRNGRSLGGEEKEVPDVFSLLRTEAPP